MTISYDPERIRSQLRTVRIERMFRLIQTKYRRRPLGAVPAPSRFSDPAGKYAVLYAAEAVRCSFWEALARNRFARRKRRVLPRADVETRLVVSLRSTLETIEITRLIEHADFLEAMEDYDITLSSP